MKTVHLSFTRRLFPVICFIALSCACFAQDVIVTKDSKKIDVTIIEINVDNIKYKRFDNPDGPTYTLPKSEIVTIVYQNGQVENPGTKTTSTYEPATTPVPATTYVPVPTSAPASMPVTELEKKSNGTLEIVAIYAPDFIVVKPAAGKEIKMVEAWFVGDSRSFKASKLNAISVKVEPGKWATTFTDETEIRLMNFNIPTSPHFEAQKIKFVADGKEMYYHLAKSEWESNQNVSDAKTPKNPVINTASTSASGGVSVPVNAQAILPPSTQASTGESVPANSQAIPPPSPTQKKNNGVFEMIRFSNDSVKFKTVEETKFYAVALVFGNQIIEAVSFTNFEGTVIWENGAQFLPGSSMSLPAAFGMGAMTLSQGAILTVYGFKTPANFKPEKIRFITDGKTEMYYNISKSEWEPNPGEKTGSQLPVATPPAQETAKTAVKQTVATDNKLSIPVKIKYLQDGKMIPNAAVYILYQESEKSELIEKTANTGNGNVVTFNVPLDKNGASWPFVVLFSKEEVNEVKELVKTTSIRAYRTPPGTNCGSIELSVTKGGGMKIEECSIQIWSIN